MVLRKGFEIFIKSQRAVLVHPFGYAISMGICPCICHSSTGSLASSRSSGAATLMRVKGLLQLEMQPDTCWLSVWTKGCSWSRRHSSVAEFRQGVQLGPYFAAVQERSHTLKFQLDQGHSSQSGLRGKGAAIHKQMKLPCTQRQLKESVTSVWQRKKLLQTSQGKLMKQPWRLCEIQVFKSKVSDLEPLHEG